MIPRSLRAAVLVAMILSIFAAAGASGKQGTLHMTSDAGDKILQGRTEDLDFSRVTNLVYGFVDGNRTYPDQIGLTPILSDGSFINFGFSVPSPGYIGIGNYTDATSFNFAHGGGNGIYADSQCGQETGSFTITEAEYEYSPGSTSFHVLKLKMTFTIQCSDASGAMHGSLVFSDTHHNGQIAVTPPTSGGTGGGGGSGDTPATPPAAPPDIQIYTNDNYAQQPLAMLNNQSMSVPMHFYSLTGFTSDLALTAWSDSPENNDFHVSITPDSVASPGEGDATLKVDVGPTALPRDYIVTVAATTNEATPRTFFTSYLVTLNCDPPMILGLDQPTNQGVTRGTSATLTVKPTGSGPFTYQWYNGSPGLTWSPISGATKSSFTTPAVNDTNTYWVRISNSCGSADSGPATVSPK